MSEKRLNSIQIIRALAFIAIFLSHVELTSTGAVSYTHLEASPLKDSFDAVYFDITDPEVVRKNVMSIKKKYGHIDVLVNNAGTEFNELIGMISRENMEKMFRVNVYGTIEMLSLIHI